MRLPPATEAFVLNRFDELVATGQEIVDSATTIPGEYREVGWNGRATKAPDRIEYDWAQICEWRTNCISLLGHIEPCIRSHPRVIETFSTLRGDQLVWGIATLKALRGDLKRGLLADLGARVEAEVLGDLLGQAETLLGEGLPNQWDHIAAGVLAGAALERWLRSACSTQAPPIPTADANGKPIKASAMIELLKKAGAYSELDAKQLRLWSGVRNACAHGEVSAVDRAGVSAMVQGVAAFLARTGHASP